MVTFLYLDFFHHTTTPFFGRRGMAAQSTRNYHYSRKMIGRSEFFISSSIKHRSKGHGNRSKDHSNTVSYFFIQSLVVFSSNVFTLFMLNIAAITNFLKIFIAVFLVPQTYVPYWMSGGKKVESSKLHDFLVLCLALGSLKRVNSVGSGQILF